RGSSAAAWLASPQPMARPHKSPARNGRAPSAFPSLCAHVTVNSVRQPAPELCCWIGRVLDPVKQFLGRFRIKSIQPFLEPFRHGIAFLHHLTSEINSKSPPL